MFKLVSLHGKVVLMDMGLAGDGAVPNQLSNIYSDMVLFCRENHLSLHMSNLTRTLISWETDADYPCGYPRIFDQCFCNVVFLKA